jgi:hypothetical protein
LKDPGVDGRITVKHIFKKLDRGMDWIDMAQNKDRRRDYALLNLRVPQNEGNFLTS